MARDPSARSPKYRRQKRPNSADQAFVELDGRRHYLGRYGSARSKEAYHRLVAEWEANGRRVPVDPNEITVTELVACFWRHAKDYYRDRDGKPSKELANYRLALRSLKTLYGPIRAIEFGPRALKTVREQLVDDGGSRQYVNRTVNRIWHVFKWAVEEEVVPDSVLRALQAVRGLMHGKLAARESEPVAPVPEAHINAIKGRVSRQVWALVQLQLLTSARGGEQVVLRTVDLDMTGRIWLYRPCVHKTTYRGRERTIYIGSQAQEVIKPFLVGRAIDAYLFSPLEAERERYAKARTHRHQPIGPPRTSRKIGARYTSGTYRQAITYGCAAAGVPVWTPHRLRHSAGTYIRKEFGLEGAQIMLGHARADVTQVYAEVNETKALKIAAEIG